MTQRITAEEIELMEKLGLFGVSPAFGQWECRVCWCVVFRLVQHYEIMHPEALEAIRDD
jgi:hypothetical protein